MEELIKQAKGLICYALLVGAFLKRYLILFINETAACKILNHKSAMLTITAGEYTALN